MLLLQSFQKVGYISDEKWFIVVKGSIIDFDFIITMYKNLLSKCYENDIRSTNLLHDQKIYVKCLTHMNRIHLCKNDSDDDK